MKGRFLYIDHDNDEGTDVSEGVQALYDLVISSMDWGSGFWSWEDALPVARIGHLAGFAKIEEVDGYVAERKHEEERAAWRAAHPELGRPADARSLLTGMSMTDLLGSPPVPHDHVFSSAGRCMWPRCVEKVV